MLNQDLKKDFFQTFLKNDGIFEAVGDYTMEKEDFEHINKDNKKLFITTLTICIEDNAKLKYNRYAAESKLKNGIKLYYTSSGKKTYIFGDEEPILCNKDWIQYPCSVEQTSFNQHSFLKVKFDFAKNHNQHIVLTKNEKMCVELHDDFSQLENHSFHITGFHMKI